MATSGKRGNEPLDYINSWNSLTTCATVSLSKMTLLH
jgi:hypothetical protein